MRHPDVFPDLTPPSGGLLALRRRLAPRPAFALRLVFANVAVGAVAAVAFFMLRPAEPAPTTTWSHPALSTATAPAGAARAEDDGVEAIVVGLEGGVSLLWLPEL